MSPADIASLLRCCHGGGVLAGEVCAACGRTLLLKLKQAVTKRRHDGSIAVGVGIVFAATKTAAENEASE